MSMRIDLTSVGGRLPVRAAFIRTVLRRAAKACRWRGDVSVAIVDDATMAALNGRFLGKKRPTDVLAFAYGDDPDGTAGEIVVSWETAARVAAHIGEPPGRELVRYCVHGLLHLCGHDDRTAEARARMETVQEQLLPGIEEFET